MHPTKLTIMDEKQKLTTENKTMYQRKNKTCKNYL